MANEILNLDYANLFCGSAPDNSSNSNHLLLTEIKLPALDTQYVDHRAAGAPIYIEIGTGMARLECTFVLVGVTTQVMALVDSWASEERNFFMYGNLRNQQTGVAAQLQAAFVGQLGRADPQNYRKGDVMHTNYSIRQIVHYELGIAEDAVYYWDFFSNVRKQKGRDFNSEINRNLHITEGQPDFLLKNLASIPVTPAAT
jgi:P2 family phage contractile tail tube protein